MNWINLIGLGGKISKGFQDPFYEIQEFRTINKNSKIALRIRDSPV